MSLIIAINPETGSAMFPLNQMLMIQELKECYKYFGAHGLSYAVLFGWEGSPYKSEIKEEVRDKQVYDAVYSEDIYDINKKKYVLESNLKTRIKEMYKNHFIIKAVKAINRAAPVPQLEMYHYYGEQIEKLKKEIDVVWDADIVKKQKQASTQNSQLKNINEMEKAQKAVKQQMSDVMRIQKIASLNDFIQNSLGTLGVSDEEEYDEVVVSTSK